MIQAVSRFIESEKDVCTNHRKRHMQMKACVFTNHSIPLASFTQSPLLGPQVGAVFVWPEWKWLHGYLEFSKACDGQQSDMDGVKRSWLRWHLQAPSNRLQ